MWGVEDRSQFHWRLLGDIFHLSNHGDIRMARRSTFTSPLRVELSPTDKGKAIRRFDALISRFEAFDPESIQDQTDSKITEIAAAARSAVEKTYPPGTMQNNQLSSLISLDYAIPLYAGRRTPPHELREALRTIKSDSIVLLRQAISDIEEDMDETAFQLPLPAQILPAQRAAFIVHGHDEGPREAVARFLEKLKITPIILHEHANKGRTLIEKFEQHGDVAFAVILLTPDDIGGLAHEKELRPRARQNVILELGYFIGKLGRDRVCAITKGDIEQPSDIVGVAYVEYDDGGAWRQKLAKEIDAAGIEIDWNRVMKPF